MYGGSLKITWTYKGVGDEVDGETKCILKLRAVERAFKLYRQGYREGELVVEAGETTYLGWWRSEYEQS